MSSRTVASRVPVRVEVQDHQHDVVRSVLCWCRLLQAMTSGLSTSWKVTLVSQCSAVFRRRSSFSIVRYGANDGWLQSRGRYWYFSESRYSSLPGRTATCSYSS